MKRLKNITKEALPLIWIGWAAVILSSSCSAPPKELVDYNHAHVWSGVPLESAYTFLDKQTTPLVHRPSEFLNLYAEFDLPSTKNGMLIFGAKGDFHFKVFVNDSLLIDNDKYHFYPSFFSNKDAFPIKGKKDWRPFHCSLEHQKLLRKKGNKICIAVQEQLAHVPEYKLTWLAQHESLPEWATSEMHVLRSDFPQFHLKTKTPHIPDHPKVDAALEINTWQTSTKAQIGIEVRGSSSQLFPKKQFAVKTKLSSNSLLKGATGNRLVLSALYADQTLVANVLLYELESQLKRYHRKYRFGELHINNDYQGIYALVEKPGSEIDTVQQSPDNYELLLQFDRQKPERKYLRSPDGKIPLHIMAPKKLDPTLKAEIESTDLGWVDTIVALQPSDPLPKYIDFDSFADYVLFQEFTKNPDGCALNASIVLTKKDGVLSIKAGHLWDFNMAFGVSGKSPAIRNPQGWLFEDAAQDRHPFYLALWKNEAFQKILKTRYQFLKLNILNGENINAKIDAILAQIPPEAIAREELKYGPFKSSDVIEKFAVFKDHQFALDFLRKWIALRLEFIALNLS